MRAPDGQPEPVVEYGIPPLATSDVVLSVNVPGIVKPAAEPKVIVHEIPSTVQAMTIPLLGTSLVVGHESVPDGLAANVTPQVPAVVTVQVPLKPELLLAIHLPANVMPPGPVVVIDEPATLVDLTLASPQAMVNPSVVINEASVEDPVIDEPPPNVTFADTGATHINATNTAATNPHLTAPCIADPSLTPTSGIGPGARAQVADHLLAAATGSTLPSDSLQM